jgi:hypothetical protein
VIAAHAPTWVIVAFLVFGGVVVLYCLSVAIDVELWYRDVRRRRK